MAGRQGQVDEPGQGPQQHPQGLEGDGQGPGGEPDPEDHQQKGLEGEEISCEISMNERMPTPKVWASPGGTSPRTIKVNPETNPPIIEEPVSKPDKGKEAGNQGPEEEGGREGDGDKEGTWVIGADEEDNKIYREFISYCEREEKSKG